MSTQFAHCHLDENTGLVWCRHLNGSWAPPFQSSYGETENPLVREDVSEETIVS